MDYDWAAIWVFELGCIMYDEECGFSPSGLPKLAFWLI